MGTPVYLTNHEIFLKQTKLDAKKHIEEVLYNSYFREDRKNFIKKREEFINELRKVTQKAWELVDIPMKIIYSKCEVLDIMCKRLCIQFSIAISLQTSANGKYFRGILIEKKAFERFELDEYTWITSCEGKFFRKIDLEDFYLISMKNSENFDYKFTKKKYEI